MILKAIATSLLCFIVLGQWVVGVKASAKEGQKVLGFVMFTIWTLILFMLLYLAGVFDFSK